MAPLAQARGQRHGEPAREMVVASSRRAQRLVAWSRRAMPLWAGRGHRRQSLYRVRDLGRGEPMVAMPALPDDRDELRLRELRQMPAGGLRGHAGMPGELARSQSSPVH